MQVAIFAPPLPPRKEPLARKQTAIRQFFNSFRPEVRRGSSTRERSERQGEQQNNQKWGNQKKKQGPAPTLTLPRQGRVGEAGKEENAPPKKAAQKKGFFSLHPVLGDGRAGPGLTQAGWRAMPCRRSPMAIAICSRLRRGRRLVGCASSRSTNWRRGRGMVPCYVYVMCLCVCVCV